jgi:hypothetical protein
MPTSSSTRVQTRPTVEGPTRPWIAIWMVTIALVCMLLVGFETALRHFGYRPSVTDTPALWAWHRRQVDRSGGQGVVLLGTSRMLDGFSLDTFRTRFPDIPITQLAILDCSCVNLLRNLAADPVFRGTVICDLPEGMMLTSATERYSKKEVTDEAWQSHSWQIDVENQIGWHIQADLRCRNPSLALKHVVRASLCDEPWPEPEMSAMRFDRSRSLRHRDSEAVAIHRSRTIAHMLAWLERSVPESIDPDEWLRQAMQIEPAVRQIQARGGKVVFVIFPYSGESWALEEKYFPKGLFWDRFAMATSAVTVHFRDVPGLARIETPDTAHIDEANSCDFTNLLIDQLVNKRIFTGQ